MNKNHLHQVWYLLVVVLVFLLVFSAVPDFSLFNYSFKKPDLFSDILRDDPRPVNKDTVAVAKDSVVKPVAARRVGNAYIEEYGNDNLRHFFSALRSSRNMPVRVAFFGDSFIEGDILCGPFRDTLQRLFGGSGVGYMPITSEVFRFRVSIQHEFSHWSTYSMVSQKNAIAPLGLPGYCFVPEEGNEVMYKPAHRKFVTAKFFYDKEAQSKVNYVLNDTIPISSELPPTQGLGIFTFPGHEFSSLKFSFPSADPLRCYGAAFEDSVGVSVDNFSMRGNPGMGLLLVDKDRMMQFNALREYKLLILQYGLNVLSENDTTGYTWYGYKMMGVVRQLKEAFPDCGILLLSVGDRCNTQKGKLATMPGVAVMRDVQRKVARQSGIAFWDMFEAMGGENSIIQYTEAKPPLAAKDYTHLTFRGGRKIAKKLADALLNEKSKYGKK